jgi:hypothetical protein
LVKISQRSTEDFLKGIILALLVIFVVLGAGVSAASSTTIYLPIVEYIATPTPTPNLNPILLPNGNFELGPVIWAETSTWEYELILEQYPYGLPADIPPYDGRWAAWLGFYEVEYSTISQQILVPNDHPYLSYWMWIDSEDLYCGNDVGEVAINGVTVDQYNLCTGTNTYTWVQRVIDLQAYRGDTVELKFMGLTDQNSKSGLFIDHVAFQASATGSLLP